MSMEKNDNQKEEDAILVGHSNSYAESTFLLGKNRMNQIFSFQDLDKSSYTKNLCKEDISDLMDSIGKSEELFRLYIAGAISKLTEEAKNRGIPDEIASHLMRMAYLRLSDAKTREEMSECNIWVADQLHENYKKFYMGDYSYIVQRAVEEIHRSKRRKMSTKTISEYILSVKMDQAEILLNSRVYNLTEISEALGYENYAYFSRQFKKYFGYSPENYIKQKK